MSGGFFRGTSAEQDTRFSNKQAKLLKSQKFAPELEHLVDMTKVKMDVMRPWIANRVTELLGFEDEVLINFIYGLLDAKEVNGKEVQISLTGFMEKNTAKFMRELWALLLSAQENASGVPQQFLDAKEEETKKKKVETDRIANEIQKKKEKEARELEQEKLRKMDGESNISRDDNGSVWSSAKDQLRASITRSTDEKESNERVSSRGRSRVSRSPHSMHQSPFSQRGSSSRSVSRSSAKSQSSSEDSRSRSISRSPRPRVRVTSSERVYRHPPRRSLSPRRRQSPLPSISPLRRRRRSTSRSRRKSLTPVSHRLRSPGRGRSRSPIRRRSRSPIRRRSRSPTRRRSRSPIWRRSRSPKRYQSRSPVRYRSRSPVRYRSRSPVRYRSRSPIRYKSRSPTRRRSPSLARQRSPTPLQHSRRSPVRPRSCTPVRRKSRTPVKRRSLALVRRRSPTLEHRRSPSIERRRSSSIRRHYQRSSSSTPRQKSLSPAVCRPPIAGRRRSQTPSRCRSPQSKEYSSESPVHHRSALPIGRKSLKHQTMPMQSRRDRVRDYEKYSPVHDVSSRKNAGHTVEARKEADSPERRNSVSLRSRKTESNEQNDILRKRSNFSPSPDEFPPPVRRVPSEDRSSSPYGSPLQPTREYKIDNASPNPTRRPREHKSRRHIPDVSCKVEESNYARDDEDQKINSSEKGLSLSSMDDGKNSLQKLPLKDKHLPERIASHISPQSKMNSVYSIKKDQDTCRKTVISKDKRYLSEDNDKQAKQKRNHRRSRKHESASDDDYSYDSEIEERKEAKRRKKDEKKLRKEEKRQRREERRRRREERRAEKQKANSIDATSPVLVLEGNHNERTLRGESHASDIEETESEQKRLEIELREKALKTLKAKKGINL